MPAAWKLALGHLWALPLSLFGLLAAAILGARPYALRPCGSWWWTGDRFFWGWLFTEKAADGRTRSTVTLGAVTVTSSRRKDDPRNVVHERVHLFQQLKWGPLYPPAYGLGAATCVAQGKDPLLDNPFEIPAYAAERGQISDSLTRKPNP